MTDNPGTGLYESVAAVCQHVARKELQQFRPRLEEICLHAVQAAFDQLVGSGKLKHAAKEQIEEMARNSGSESSQQDPLGGLIQQKVSETTENGANLKGAVESYIAQHGRELFENETIQRELNSVLMEKTKNVFKQATESNGFDLKTIVLRMVEKALDARGAGKEGAGEEVQKEEIKKAIREHLNQNMASELSEALREEARNYFSSDELKELLDQKFRAIDLYLKTDLIPKVVKREIKALQEQS